MCPRSFLLSVICGSLLCATSSADDPKPPLGRFVTVASPVDLTLQSVVKKAALELEAQSQQESRKAVLVLEIQQGTSSFGGVRDLVNILTLHEISHVRTIAWIPKTVTGHHVIVALACNEIVIHPDAEFGDIGGGESIAASDYRRDSILTLVRQRHNPQISTALALAMMDRDQVVVRADIEQDPVGSGRFVTEVLTNQEYQDLVKRRPGITIQGLRQIKEAGSLGIFRGSAAAKEGILVARTAKDRTEIIEIYGLPTEALREPNSRTGATKARLVKASGELTPMAMSFVSRQIDRALGEGANLIVFHLDSPVGDPFLCDDLAKRIAEIDPKTRTVAYIPTQAISGGLLLAAACDEIYMHPDARIGAAARMQNAKERDHFEDNHRTALRETLKLLADKKNRPSAVYYAMVDPTVRVFRVTHQKTGRVWFMTDDELRTSNGEWNQGNVIPETAEDQLLIVDGNRAVELRIAEPVVSDFGDLKMRLGVSPEEELQAAEPTWIDKTIFVLNSRQAKYVLLVIAIVGIYLEMHVTTGLFGIASALAVALFFWATFLGGTAGWLEVILFILGIGCIAMEVFVLPGFGVFGITGGLLTLVALVMACQTFSFDVQRNIEAVTYDLGTVGAAIASVIVLALVANRYLPKMPFFNRMVLSPPGAEDFDPDRPRLRPEFSSSFANVAGFQGLLGAHGHANTVLRPAGKAEVDGRFVDVISDGPYINAGTPIEVVAVTGNRIIVRALD